MIRNEVVINEELCHGCGYCVLFCPRGCLDFSGEQPGPMYSGYETVKVIHSERCNGCGICTRMCPCGALEIHLAIEETDKALRREKVAGVPRILRTVGFGDCVGCQKAVVGRMIAEALSDMDLEGRFLGVEAVRCPSSTAFGRDFKVVIEREDRPVSLQGESPQDILAVEVWDNPIDKALELKAAYPERLVFVVQDGSKLDALGMEPFHRRLLEGGNITIIHCSELIYRGDPAKERPAPPASPLYGPERRMLLLREFPMLLADRVSTYKEVSYCARGAITSPSDYEKTKGYLKKAFRNQMDRSSLGFVEILCACFAQAYRSPYETLQWIHDEVVQEWPLGEYERNIDFTQRKALRPGAGGT